MPVVATCGHLLVDGYDLSGDLSSIRVNAGSEALDATTFGNTTRIKAGGLLTASLGGHGLLNIGTSETDAVLFARLGRTPVAVTALLHGITVDSTNEPAYGLGAVETKLDFGINVGELLTFSVETEPAADLVRACVLENFLSSVASTVAALTGNGMNYGAAATSEDMYAGLHVMALSTTLGTSLTAIIQAASSSGFGTTNTRVSFTVLTCKAGQYLSPPTMPSALSTDQPWYRSRVTLSTGTGAGGSANGLIWMSIQ